MTERSPSPRGAAHRVIPHGHWGPLMDRPAITTDRAAAEAELGLAPCAPAHRPGRRAPPGQGHPAAHRRRPRRGAGRRAAAGAVRTTARTCPTIPASPPVPYARGAPRRSTTAAWPPIDVLALPLEGGTYLTTGQAADAVGAGSPPGVTAGPTWPRRSAPRASPTAARPPTWRPPSTASTTRRSTGPGRRRRRASARRSTGRPWRSRRDALLDEVAADAEARF